MDRSHAPRNERRRKQKKQKHYNKKIQNQNKRRRRRRRRNERPWKKMEGNESVKMRGNERQGSNPKSSHILALWSSWMFDISGSLAAPPRGPPTFKKLIHGSLTPQPPRVYIIGNEMKGNERIWQEMNGNEGKWKEMKGNERTRQEWKEMKVKEGNERIWNERKWKEMKGKTAAPSLPMFMGLWNSWVSLISGSLDALSQGPPTFQTLIQGSRTPQLP